MLIILSCGMRDFNKNVISVHNEKENGKHPWPVYSSSSKRNIEIARYKYGSVSSLFWHKP
jgi:hypothetical protein